VFSELRARWSARRKRVATRPAAYDGARDLCALVGEAAVAADFKLAPDSSREDVADAFAATYLREARSAARNGALKGFEDFDAKRV
jgi:hypothetical protein